MKKIEKEKIELAYLKEQLASTARISDNNEEALRKERENGHRLSKIVEEKKLIISSLKSDLASALETIALQKGYLSRVAEDDGLREGVTQQVTRQTIDSFPVRHGPPSAIYHSPVISPRDFADYERPGSSRPMTIKDKPWFER